jgi:hypothetical protein
MGGKTRSSGPKRRTKGPVRGVIRNVGHPTLPAKTSGGRSTWKTIIKSLQSRNIENYRVLPRLTQCPGARHGIASMRTRGELRSQLSRCLVFAAQEESPFCFGQPLPNNATNTTANAGCIWEHRWKYLVICVIRGFL